MGHTHKCVGRLHVGKDTHRWVRTLYGGRDTAKWEHSMEGGGSHQVEEDTPLGLGHIVLGEKRKEHGDHWRPERSRTLEDDR